jgi:hypothetical protein
MMRTLLSLLVFTLVGVSPAEAPKAPFSLAVVPTFGGVGGTIQMARNKARDFYVVLTNVSGESQAVWESWNSWGYRAISIEMTTADGKRFVVSRRQGYFTKNYPSTFLIGSGEHQVYAIHLDEWWETHPSLPKTDNTPVTLKAVYEISPTPESAQYKVWAGRIESHSYKFSLQQW